MRALWERFKAYMRRRRLIRQGINPDGLIGRHEQRRIRHRLEKQERKLAAYTR